MTEQEKDETKRSYKSYEEFCAQFYPRMKVIPAEKGESAAASFGKRLARRVMNTEATSADGPYVDFDVCDKPN